MRLHSSDGQSVGWCQLRMPSWADTGWHQLRPMRSRFIQR